MTTTMTPSDSAPTRRQRGRLVPAVVWSGGSLLSVVLGTALSSCQFG